MVENLPSPVPGAAREKPFSVALPGCDERIGGYRRDGRQPGVLFIHGFRSNCDGEKARALTLHAAHRGHATCRFDQRGRGSTGSRFRHFTLSRALADCVAVLDGLTGPTVVVGSSLGALLALCLVKRRPGRVAGLLLLAPAVRFVARLVDSLPQHDLDSWRSTGTRRFADNYEGGEYALGYGFRVDSAHYRDLSIAPPDCPVAIIHGARDEVLPPADAHWLAARIDAPSCGLDIVADGDHRLGAAIPLMCTRLDSLLGHPSDR